MCSGLHRIAVRIADGGFAVLAVPARVLPLHDRIAPVHVRVSAAAGRVFPRIVLAFGVPGTDMLIRRGLAAVLRFRLVSAVVAAGYCEGALLTSFERGSAISGNGI